MSSNSENDVQETLLYSARHGALPVVRELLAAVSDGKLTIDINYKGKRKSNFGWTPLHLATYFGHVEVVRALLEAGANVDAVNDTGDTALHKATFIGHEELVVMLLTHKADVNIMNGEGRTAADMCKTRDVQRLVLAAQRTERADRERALLTAAKDGRIDDINELLNSTNPPNINCADAQGNTCLHCAAYRGHTRIAVLLLQNGVDTTLRNKSGQLAVDLAKDNEIREVLSVRPLQQLQHTAARFEGPLLKRSRFLGWRPVWAVLQRGVVQYYGSRGEAARAESRGRARKYLDAARLSAPAAEPAALLVHYSDGDTHRLAVPPHEPNLPAARQEWVTAFTEHIAYAGHYLWAGAAPDKASEATEDLDEDSKPLGSMQDALTSATNKIALLDTQLRECGLIITAIEKTMTVGNSLHHSAYMRFQHASGSAAEALAALRHAAALVAQALPAHDARLARELERNRVLEEALAALARTHHALEMSVAEELSKGKRQKKTSQPEQNDDFYDLYDNEASDEDDTLVTCGAGSAAASPWGSSPDLTPTEPRSQLESETPREDRSFQSLHSAVSPASSRGTLVSHGGHVYRNARQYKRTNKHSSEWSL